MRKATPSLADEALHRHPAHLRLVTARLLGITGVLCYNWWIIVPIIPGMMPSRNGFFSDLEVLGRPHAMLLLNADLLAALLMFAALVVRGPLASHGQRREWYYLLIFTVAGALGSRYPYTCSEGLSAACRHLEWTGQLPWHHYLHMFAGIVEFAALTVAAFLATRRTRGLRTLTARAYRTIWLTLMISYPLLGAVYLTDRLGTFIEPLFFVTFSAMLLTALFEPAQRLKNPAPGR